MVKDTVSYTPPEAQLGNDYSPSTSPVSDSQLDRPQYNTTIGEPPAPFSSSSPDSLQRFPTPMRRRGPALPATLLADALSQNAVGGGEINQQLAPEPRGHAQQTQLPSAELPASEPLTGISPLAENGRRAGGVATSESPRPAQLAEQAREEQTTTRSKQEGVPNQPHTARVPIGDETSSTIRTSVRQDSGHRVADTKVKSIEVDLPALQDTADVRDLPFISDHAKSAAHPVETDERQGKPRTETGQAATPVDPDVQAYALFPPPTAAIDDVNKRGAIDAQDREHDDRSAHQHTDTPYTNSVDTSKNSINIHYGGEPPISPDRLHEASDDEPLRYFPPGHREKLAAITTTRDEALRELEARGAESEEVQRTTLEFAKQIGEVNREAYRFLREELAPPLSIAPSDETQWTMVTEETEEGRREIRAPFTQDEVDAIKEVQKILEGEEGIIRKGMRGRYPERTIWFESLHFPGERVTSDNSGLSNRPEAVYGILQLARAAEDVLVPTREDQGYVLDLVTEEALRTIADLPQKLIRHNPDDLISSGDVTAALEDTGLITQVEAGIQSEEKGLSTQEMQRRIARDREIITRLKSKDTDVVNDAARDLFRQYDHFISKHARFLYNHIPSTAVDLEDVLQEGRIAFLRDAKKWDADSGLQLITYTFKGLVGAMWNYLYTDGFQVHIPIAAANINRQIQDINTKRMQEQKPPLTDQEIAEKFDMPRTHSDATRTKRSVAEILQIAPLTLYMRSLQGGPTGNKMRRDSFTDEIDVDEFEIAAQPELDIAPLWDSALTEFARSGANSHEQGVNAKDVELIRMWIGVQEGGEKVDPQNFAQIARHLNMTPQHVHQRITRGSKRLEHYVRRYIDNEDINDY
jgi:DNA-directed RNA polymerase sigma subunit (sigma70/sigma32)